MLFILALNPSNKFKVSLYSFPVILIIFVILSFLVSFSSFNISYISLIVSSLKLLFSIFTFNDASSKKVFTLSSISWFPVPFDISKLSYKKCPLNLTRLCIARYINFLSTFSSLLIKYLLKWYIVGNFSFISSFE